MSIYGRFYFRPSAGEQIHTELRPTVDASSAIWGMVRDISGEPVTDAITLLFRVADESEPELLARFATDEEGQFFFGPLKSGELYMVKVFKSGIQVRELEISGN